MPIPSELRGLWIPIVTPLTPSGDVDTRGVSNLAHHLFDLGATGLVALGTTGEPATLTAVERLDVVTTCADVCRSHGRPLMIGAGTNDTHMTVEEVLRWNELVPDACALLVVVPYYTRPSEAGVIEHMRRVAAASTIPIVVYNVPYRTGRGLGAVSLLELAATPNVAGVKQAVGAVDRDTLEVLRAAPPGFQVLCGDDAFIAPLVLLGASGAIAAAANVRTAEFAQLVDMALAGDAPSSTRLAHALLPTVDAGFAEPSPAVFKAALHQLGLVGDPGVRSPLTRASPAATAALMSTLDGTRETGVAPSR